MSVQRADDPAIPLVCDLDGTLILGDVSSQAFMRLFGTSPLRAAGLAITSLRRGRGWVKTALAEASPGDPTTLPFRAEVVQHLHQARNAGRTLVLATGAAQAEAERIADHLGLFDAVIGSSDRISRVGEAKARALLDRFGAQGFDYIGDSHQDLPIWRVARSILLAAPPLQGRFEAALGRPFDQVLGSTDD